MTYVHLFAGFIYLLGGGDLLVRGAVGLARRLSIPNMVVALSIVAFGTSLPELVVSIQASLTNHPGLILGNVVGSNIANVLLVGGAAAVVYPLKMRDQGVRRTGTVMLAISLVFAGLCLSGEVTRFEGLLLMAGFVAGLALTAGSAVQAYTEQEAATPLDWTLGLPQKLPTIVFFITVGTLALPLGADFLVEAAVDLSERFGVSETVVGLSVVAIGTSLPEGATTVVAVMQRRPGMAMGTIVGSNIFNILGIMGIAALISAEPIVVSSRFLSFDLPVMIGTSAGLVGLAWLGRPFGRALGVTFLLAYAGYLTALYLSL